MRTVTSHLHLLALVLLFMLQPVAGMSQIVVLRDQEQFNADSIRRDYDDRPYFGLYKDNYFTAGSISQRLTKSTLPLHSYLFLFYTQKSMWNIFEESMPFHDLNFNPGIGVSRLIIVKGQLVGKATMLIEHESNGRDGLESRSWNKVSWSGAAFIDPNLMVHAKFWIPIVDGENNRDILKYSGIYQAGVQALSSNRRWVLDATFVKRKGWNFNGNVTLNVGYRLSRKANQFLMLHYYNGYGECLLDYNRFHSRLRIGMLIRPNFFSDF